MANRLAGRARRAPPRNLHHQASGPGRHPGDRPGKSPAPGQQQPGGGPTLHQAAENWLRALGPGWARNTLKNARSAIRALEEIAYNEPIQKVDAGHIARALSRPLKPWTRAGYAAQILKLLSWCWVQGMRGEPPRLRDQGLVMRSKSPARQSPLTEAELEAILDHATGPGIRAVIILGTDAGLRLNEIRTCNPAADWHPNSETLTVHDQKRRKERTIPVGPRAHAILATYAHATDLLLAAWGTAAPNRKAAQPNECTIRNHLKISAQAIGRADLRIHDLRHTYATRLRDNGVDIAVIAYMMGHESIGYTSRYLHAAPAHLARAAAQGLILRPPVPEPAQINQIRHLGSQKIQ